jgi:stage II sporulation protein E
MHEGCDGKMLCVKFFEKVITEAVGKRMILEKCQCKKRDDNGICKIVLTEGNEYSLMTGISRVSKLNDKVCGDNFTCFKNIDGRYIIALSDGMGSGHLATAQSELVVCILEKFLEAGIDKTNTINLLNSILMIKSSDEAFATVDLSVVDLNTGKVELVKYGAAPTFIKRKNEIEQFETISLPVGILPNLRIDTKESRLCRGEYIFMMSDGICDAFREDAFDDTNLTEFILNLGDIEPQDMANSIIEEACNKSSNIPFDDMTVMVAKLI